MRDPIAVPRPYSMPKPFIKQDADAHITWPGSRTGLQPSDHRRKFSALTACGRLTVKDTRLFKKAAAKQRDALTDSPTSTIP
jgi:hypothetical protein